jgi:hypothetical protein
MSGQVDLRKLFQRIAREEAALARRAARGDRAAFDTLFDRYCARMAHVFRALPDTEAKAKTWEALEQVFASLACTSSTPLAARAFRVAHASRTGRPRAVARPGPSRRRVSRSDR